MYDNDNMGFDIDDILAEFSSFSSQLGSISPGPEAEPEEETKEFSEFHDLSPLLLFMKCYLLFCNNIPHILKKCNFIFALFQLFCFRTVCMFLFQDLCKLLCTGIVRHFHRIVSTEKSFRTFLALREEKGCLEIRQCR